MRVKSLSLMAILVMTSSTAFAQHYYSSPVISEHVIYSTPVVTTQVTVPTVNPLSICNCGGNSTTGCDCRNLNCQITLPPCKTSGPTVKKPIGTDIVGKIPKFDVNTDCQKLLYEFEYPTDVPQIHCTTETCTEIGKKNITCVPGCSFSVCVPINDCTKQTVECKLVKKVMKMQIWQRNDPRLGVAYDVYVSNDTDPSSAYHAGGMPAKWLVVHCATPAQIKSKFPDAKKSDGTPLVYGVGKDAKSVATDADVDLRLVIDEEQLKKEIEAAAKSSATHTKNAGSLTETGPSLQKSQSQPTSTSS
jgi:hypothetical protein